MAVTMILPLSYLNGACDEARKQGKHVPPERGRRVLSWGWGGMAAADIPAGVEKYCSYNNRQQYQMPNDGSDHAPAAY